MAIAAVLNAVTTRHKIVTVMRMADSTREGFFVNTAQIPEDLRRSLSPVYVAMRQHAAGPPAPPQATGDDMIERLERLVALCTAGSLTDDEFAAAKAALPEASVYR